MTDSEIDNEGYSWVVSEGEDGSYSVQPRNGISDSGLITALIYPRWYPIDVGARISVYLSAIMLVAITLGVGDYIPQLPALSSPAVTLGVTGCILSYTVRSIVLHAEIREHGVSAVHLNGYLFRRFDLRQLLAITIILLLSPPSSGALIIIAYIVMAYFPIKGDSGSYRRHITGTVCGIEYRTNDSGLSDVEILDILSNKTQDVIFCDQCQEQIDSGRLPRHSDHSE